MYYSNTKDMPIDVLVLHFETSTDIDKNDTSGRCPPLVLNTSVAVKRDYT